MNDLSAAEHSKLLVFPHKLIKILKEKELNKCQKRGNSKKWMVENWKRIKWRRMNYQY